MPTNRTIRARGRRNLDDYRASEALTLKVPLIPTKGFYDPAAVGTRCAEIRDEAAIGDAWRIHEEKLLRLWIEGWLPAATAKFTGFTDPGRPGTRPPGWWKHRAPEPRRRGESERKYLDRLGLWQDGEKAAGAAYERRAQIIRTLAPSSWSNS
jgi:hypothetical protein